MYSKIVFSKPRELKFSGHLREYSQTQLTFRNLTLKEMQIKSRQLDLWEGCSSKHRLYTQ